MKQVRLSRSRRAGHWHRHRCPLVASQASVDPGCQASLVGVRTADDQGRRRGVLPHGYLWRQHPGHVWGKAGVRSRGCKRRSWSSLPTTRFSVGARPFRLHRGAAGSRAVDWLPVPRRPRRDRPDLPGALRVESSGVPRFVPSATQCRSEGMRSLRRLASQP